LDELFKKHRQYLPEESKDDSDFVTTLCCSFVFYMMQWNLSSGEVKQLFKHIFETKVFELKDPDSVEKRIMDFIDNVGVGGRKKARNQESSPPNSPEKQNYLGSLTQNQILKEGLLNKQGDAWKNWKLRYFLLTKGFMQYKDHVGSEPKGFVELRKCCCVINPKREFSFAVLYGKQERRNYFFRTKDQKEMESWVSAITDCIIDPIPNISLLEMQNSGGGSSIGIFDSFTNEGSLRREKRSNTVTSASELENQKEKEKEKEKLTEKNRKRILNFGFIEKIEYKRKRIIR